MEKEKKKICSCVEALINDTLGSKDEVYGFAFKEFVGIGGFDKSKVVNYGLEYGNRCGDRLVRETLSKDTITKIDLDIEITTRKSYKRHSFVMLGTVAEITVEKLKDVKRDYYVFLIASKNGIGGTFGIVADTKNSNIGNIPVYFLQHAYFSKFHIGHNCFQDYLTRNSESNDGVFMEIKELENKKRNPFYIYYRKDCKGRFFDYMHKVADVISKERIKAVSNGERDIIPTTEEDIFSYITSDSYKAYNQTLDIFLTKYFREYDNLADITRIRRPGRKYYVDINSSEFIGGELIGPNTELLEKLFGYSAVSLFRKPVNKNITLFPYIFYGATEIKTLKTMREKYGDDVLTHINPNVSQSYLKDYSDKKRKLSAETLKIRKEYKEESKKNAVRHIVNTTMFRRFSTTNADSPLTKEILLDVSPMVAFTNVTGLSSTLRGMVAEVSKDKITLDSLLYTYYSMIFSSDRVKYKYTTKCSNKLLGRLLTATFSFYSACRVIELANAFYSTTAYRLGTLSPNKTNYEKVFKLYKKYNNAKRTLNSVLLDILRYSCMDVLRSEEYVAMVNEDYESITCRVPNTGTDISILDKYNVDRFDSRLMGEFASSHFIIPRDVDKEETKVSTKNKKQTKKASKDKVDVIEVPSFIREALEEFSKL